MTHIAFLDKDGTLIRPKSGHKFVQSPDDQELIPGVSDRLKELTNKGYELVIISNQGGCGIYETTAEDFPIGAYYLRNGEHFKKVVDKIKMDSSATVLILDDPWTVEAAESLYFLNDSVVFYQHKTLFEAITEMHFAMGLTGVRTAYFCPDSLHQKGNSKIVSLDYNTQLVQVSTEILDSPLEIIDPPLFTTGQPVNYRKPSPDMVFYHIRNCNRTSNYDHSSSIFIGDRPEDLQCAKSAGLAFVQAETWLAGGYPAVNSVLHSKLK